MTAVGLVVERRIWIAGALWVAGCADFVAVTPEGTGTTTETTHDADTMAPVTGDGTSMTGAATLDSSSTAATADTGTSGSGSSDGTTADSSSSESSSSESSSSESSSSESSSSESSTEGDASSSSSDGSSSDGSSSDGSSSDGSSSDGSSSDGSSSGGSSSDGSSSGGSSSEGSSSGGSSSSGGPVCGDGNVDLGEDCDDMGESASCNDDCTVAACGDGILNTTAGEACDDDDLIDGDGCDADCSLTVVSSLIAGGEHSCALLDTGTVRCWGSAALGQLGYGNLDDVGDDELPSAVGTVDVGDPVVALVPGYRHTCALLDTASVRCWGDSEFGQLGYGNTATIGDDEAPSDAGDLDLGGDVAQLASGYFHSCVVLDGGDVRCWGGNSNGQLGYGDTIDIGDDELPSAVGPVAVGGTVLQIGTGFLHTCALLDGGSVRCWGDGNNGALGYGNTTTIGDDELPTAVGTIALGGTVTQIAVGAYHNCALLDGGSVRCWGGGGFGQLGYGTTANIGDTELPNTVGPVALGGNAVQLVAGFFHTCALMDDGAVRCWGLSNFGQIGNGNTDNVGDDELPTMVGPVSIGDTVSSLATSNDHSCALLDSGAVRCWGLGAGGRLGYAATANIGDDEIPSTAGDVSVF